LRTSAWLLPQKEHIVRWEARAMESWVLEKKPVGWREPSRCPASLAPLSE
jgi:hypothetical protein